MGSASIVGPKKGPRTGLLTGLNSTRWAASGGNTNPIADFSRLVTAMSVAFTDMSSDIDGTIASWDWDFGDGTTHGTTQNPTHVYATPGAKTVTLIVTDDGGATATVSKTATPKAPPVAAYSSLVTALSVAFTDTSTDADGTIASWDWDFGDGTAHGTTQNPTHVYATGGAKTVVLVVTDNDGLTNSVSHSVTPLAAPVAGFSSVVTGLSVAFTDTSTDADGTIASWDWDFGDGTSHGTTQNPTHVYTLIGSKTVTLTVTDNSGLTNAISHTATPVVATDGPSNVYVPDTGAKWVAVGLPAPDHLFLCQETSGNLAAAIGTATLTANGTPLYAQAVASWVRTFLGTADATASQRFHSTQAALDLAAGESAAWLFYGSYQLGAAANRRIFTAANDSNGVRSTSGGLATTAHNNVAANSAGSHSSALVRPWLWYRNATTNVSGLMTVLEHVLGTHDESVSSGAGHGIGPAGANTAGNCRYGMVAFWRGADAETIAAKATLTKLGWSVAW